ncbi:hypothetical protein [Acidiphilium sp. C61]|uniref:hypothetical protein n=1 Tax=Acidiphilium sp. C61 TaxID=1671485 RepID=UPI00157A2C00|nr:hypothetical protein [Acidiphilium sp. C61]
MAALPRLAGLTYNGTTLTSAAGLSVGNNQYSSSSAVTATNQSNAVTLTANGTTLSGDTLSLSGAAGTYTAQAIAQSNNAANALTVNADQLAGSAGLASVQTDMSGATSTLSNPTVEIAANTTANTAIQNSSITLGGTNGNVLRSLAYGNANSNTLNATSTGLNVYTATAPATAVSLRLAPIALMPRWHCSIARPKRRMSRPAHRRRPR